MTQLGWILGWLLVLSVVAWGQTIDSYQILYYAVGATAPLQTETFLAPAAVCNQAAPTVTTTVNPTRLIWDDAALAGRVCIAPISQTPTGPLFSLPIGASYEGTLVAVNAAGNSGESNRAPFSRLAAAAARSGVRFSR